MKTRPITIQDMTIGDNQPLVLMAGLCVIESRDICMDLAARLVSFAKNADVPLIFKASYDKANRTSIDAFRGPGLRRGLEILAEVKRTFNVPIMTDVHRVEEVEPAAKVADVLQLPAFLCRQTDLVVALGNSQRVINIKKGQFLAPEDMRHIIKKIEHTGNHQIMLTERGASFGYGQLVADMRSLLIMREFGYPIIFDATHSVQRPGGAEAGTGGDGKWAPALARAAAATGIDGVFIETHINPETALSDKANAIAFDEIPALWTALQDIHAITTAFATRTARS